MMTKNGNPSRFPEGATVPAPEAPEAAGEERLAVPLNCGLEYVITEDGLERWQKLFPDLNVEEELRRMIRWLKNHPRRAGTPLDAERLILFWLRQDRTFQIRTIC